MDFSIEEIREQLELMGYKNVQPEVLNQFKRDLNQIPPEEFLPDDSYKSKHFSSSDSSDSSDDSPVNRYSYGNDDAETQPTLPNHQKISAPLTRETIHTTNRAIPRKIAPRRMLPESTSNDYDFENDLQTNIGPLSPVSHDYPVRPVLKKSAGNSHEVNKTSQIARDVKSSNSTLQSQRYFNPSMRRARFADDPVEDVKNYTTESIRTKELFMEPSSSKGKPKTFKKVDPVQRYHDYRRIWRVQSEPGQDGHKKLRWAVKAAMLVHEVPAAGPRTKLQLDPYTVNTRSETEFRKNNWNVPQRRKSYDDEDIF